MLISLPPLKKTQARNLCCFFFSFSFHFLLRFSFFSLRFTLPLIRDFVVGLFFGRGVFSCLTESESQLHYNGKHTYFNKSSRHKSIVTPLHSHAMLNKGLNLSEILFSSYRMTTIIITLQGGCEK